MKSREELEALKEELTALREQRAELTDEELKQVNGGTYHTRQIWDTEESVEFVFKIGDMVEVSAPFWFGTVHCKITDIKADAISVSSTGGAGVGGAYSYRGFTDYYYCEETEYHFLFPNGWYMRNSIQVRLFD